MKQSKKTLTIKSTSWNKDLNDLIDFESYELNNDTMTVNGPGQLKIINDILDFNPYQQQDEAVPYIFNQASSLVDITIQNGSYYLKKLTKELSFQEEIDKNPYCPWLMFKGNHFPEKNKKYHLLQGDVIKIGRLKLQVKTIHLGLPDQEQPSKKDNEEDEQDKKTEGSFQQISKKTKPVTKRKGNIPYLSDQKLINNKVLSLNTNVNILTTVKPKAKRICRICYCDDDTIDNPLIRPCSCAGTMKYIHFACLKHWLETKICIKASSNACCTVYLAKETECELCKSAFPDFIRSNGKLYELLGFKPQGKSYVILQSLVKDKKNNKYLYFLNFDHTNSICLGRQQEVDVLLSDISVSRYHCIIKKLGNRIYLEDNDSKFGTGLLIQSPALMILEGDPLFVQINRTLLQLSVKLPFTLFSCCSEPLEVGLLTYQRMNSKYLRVVSNEVIKDDVEDVSDVEEGPMSPQQRKHAFLNMIDYTDDKSNDKVEKKEEKRRSKEKVHFQFEMKKCEVSQEKKLDNIQIGSHDLNDSGINPITTLINPSSYSNRNHPVTDNLLSNPNQYDYNNNVNANEYQNQDYYQDNYQEPYQGQGQGQVQVQEQEQDQEQEANNNVPLDPYSNQMREDNQFQEEVNNEEGNNPGGDDIVNYGERQQYNNNHLFNVYNYNN